MIKRLFFMCVLTSLVSLFMACNSDDRTKDNPGGSSATFNLKGNWRLTTEDLDEGDTASFRFSTDNTGLSSDAYGEIRKTQFAYKDKKLAVNFIDIDNDTFAIVFDAPDPKANTFTLIEEHQEVITNEDEGSFETTISTKYTLERLSK